MTMPNLPGDPSPRTLEQVRMAIENLRELFEAKFDIIETRFAETDKALKLHQDRMDLQPTPDVLNERLIALKESVEIRFDGLKELANTLAVSNEKKLELALSSQQEAAKKAESSNSKLIDSLTDKLNDLKDRVVAMSTSRAMVPIIISCVGSIVAIAVGVIIATRGGS